DLAETVAEVEAARPLGRPHQARARAFGCRDTLLAERLLDVAHESGLAPELRLDATRGWATCVHVDQEGANAVPQLIGDVPLLLSEHPASAVRGGHRVVRSGEHDLVEGA